LTNCVFYINIPLLIIQNYEKELIMSVEFSRRIDELFKFARKNDVAEVSEYIKNLETYANQHGEDINELVNVTNSLGQNLLHISATHKDAVMTKFLLRYGVSAYAKDKDGDYPVHLAAYNGSPSLKVLLDKIPGLANVENNAGLTPLSYALCAGQRCSVDLLLKHGASEEAESHTGTTPISYATACEDTGHSGVVDLLFGAIGRRDMAGVSLFDRDDRFFDEESDEEDEDDYDQDGEYSEAEGDVVLVPCNTIPDTDSGINSPTGDAMDTGADFLF